MKLQLVLLILFLFTSCCKNDEYINNSCVENVLDKYKMKPKTDKSFSCHTMSLYMLDGMEYYALDCCICDMMFNPFDCNFKDYFYINGQIDTIKAEYFHKNAIIIGIVGAL